MVKQAPKARGKGRAGTPGKRAEEDDAQPDWRKPPARPRAKMRPKQFTTSKPPGAGREGRERGGATLVLPSRDVVMQWVRISLLALVALGVAFGMYQLLRLPMLAVSANSTEIGGAVRTAPERIYAASGAEGRNIFLVRESDVVSRVRGLPGIAGVRVHLRLPNTLIIDVREHAPLVQWQGVTTTLWLAPDGSHVPQAGDTPPLTLVDQTGTSLGDSEKLWPLVLANLSELHAARPDIAAVFYGKAEGLYFVAPGGWQVWLGDSGPMTGKLGLAQAAEEEIARRGAKAQVIDARISGSRALWR